MAHSREGAPVMSPTDFSPHSSLFSTAGELKDYLTNLLESKEKQLQQAGALGQRVLAQQAELEERVRQLGFDTIDDDATVDREAYDRYHEIADAIARWDEENAQLSSGFANSKRPTNGRIPSPSLQFTDLPPREEPERPKHAANSAAQSRRAKNAAHRADDVEFAFEIGSGLLTEVRRLQSLLGERDKAIQDMKEEKDDLEKMIDNLQKALRQQEQAAEGYKDANWNLEYQMQEQAAQLTEKTGTIQRLESENKRLTNELSHSRTHTEQQKAEIERLNADIAAMKAKHETDIAQARKHAAGLSRDKSDLQQTIDNLKAEAARKRFPRFGAPLTPNGAETSDYLSPTGEKDESFTPGASARRRLDSTPVHPSDEFGEFPDSPEASPVRPTFLAANHPNNEIEALQQRLAHAQRQINTLKGTLQREKQLKLEYRNKLETLTPGGVVDEDDDNEEYVDEEVAEPKTAPKRTPHRPTRGRGRGRGGRVGISLIERLGMVAHSPASDWEDDHRIEDVSPPPKSPTSTRFSRTDDDEGDALFGSRQDLQTIVERREFERERTPERELDHEPPRSPSPTPLEPPSNRASVDGMDPAFANILRRAPSNGSAYAASPLRHVLGRSVRGGVAGRRSRGGVSYKEPRPPSFIDAPGVLATELGGAGTSPMKGIEIPQENELIKQFIDVETAEIGCQTEPEEVPPPTPAPPAPEPEPVPEPEPLPEKVMADVAIQSEPEPLPPPEPKPVLVETSMQTEEEPVIIIPKSDVGIQHEQEPEPVVVVLKSEIGIQHEEEKEEVPPPPPPPEPVRIEAGISTDPEPEPVLPVMVQAEVQTIPPPEPLDEVRTPMQLPRQRLPSTISNVAISRRSTITQHDMANLSWSADSSSAGDTTITRSFLGPAQTYEEEDESNETETGAETETDMDDYHDARQSILMTTPSASESRDDFHSVYTVTDIEGGSSEEDDLDDDAESIKVSNMGSIVNPSTTSFVEDDRVSSHSFDSRPSQSPPPPPIEYKTASVSADFLPEPERITVTVEVPVPVPVVPPKPEVREISIQTDEWKPPTPPPAPLLAPVVQAMPQGFGLYRVGSNIQQQFQFVGPPVSAAASTASLAPSTTLPQQANATVATAPGPRSPISGVVSPVGTIPMPVPMPAPGPTILRETSQIFGRPRTSASDRRISIESAMSSAIDDHPRSRVPSSSTPAPTIVDKSKPPMMALPPPPRAPPPPSSMPPPNFIPERRIPTASTTSHEAPPPRPSSPPPAELIQRATTPLGSILGIPSRGNSVRIHGSTLPPPHSSVSQRPSTGSFRSVNASTYIPQSLAVGGIATFTIRDRERREFSSTSLAPSDRSVASPRSSVSSEHAFGHLRSPTEPITPEKSADITPRAHNLGNTTNGGTPNSGTATDPTVIHAITQTMIGEFLYKYTRKAIGKGHGERRHKRFFWVHPYTKTLYWSSADPGSSNVSESSAKSAYIEGVRSVLDPNPMPPGLYQYSVVVSTPQREMKITAPTKERHDIWLNALKYLLSRPSGPSVQSPLNVVPQSPASVDFTDDDRRQVLGASPQSQRSARSPRAGEPWNTTPRQRRSRSQLSIGGSIGKRSGTPALEYLRYNHAMDAPYSPGKSFVDVPVQDSEELDFELHDEMMSDDGYEGLENVRACCDGRHTVGHKHHHHHHHHHDHAPAHQPQAEHLEPEPAARPVSPAWSFRSRAGSSHSHDTGGGGGGGGGIFSWGRGEDGKLRFGSRRIKNVPNHDS